MVPKLKVGFATWSGVLAALTLAGGAVYAATQERTVESVTAAVGAVATFLTVLGGRYRQAVEIIRAGVNQPVVVERKVVPSPFVGEVGTANAAAEFTQSSQGVPQVPGTLLASVEGPGDQLSPPLEGTLVEGAPPPDTGNDRAVKP